MRKRVALVAFILAMPFGVNAAELRMINVDRQEDGFYTLESVVWFDAQRRAVFEVFADWDVATQFSSAIVESRDTGPDADGRMQYYVRNRGCILFFCKSLVRSGSASLTPLDMLEAKADPELSDFEVSDEVWTFRSENGGTAVRYSLRMKPAFWIPPLIGPYLIKRKLRNDSSDAIDRIEKIAQEWTSPDD